MLEYDLSGSFQRDLKLMRKRRMDIQSMREVMGLIIEEKPLPPELRNHLLHGKKYEGKMERHIKPDWLLVYRIDPVMRKVVFHRTGSHSDLFKHS